MKDCANAQKHFCFALKDVAEKQNGEPLTEELQDPRNGMLVLLLLLLLLLLHARIDICAINLS